MLIEVQSLIHVLHQEWCVKGQLLLGSDFPLVPYLVCRVWC